MAFGALTEVIILNNLKSLKFPSGPYKRTTVEADKKKCARPLITFDPYAICRFNCAAVSKLIADPCFCNGGCEKVNGKTQAEGNQ